MRKMKWALLLLIAGCVSLSAQQVETLVSGPSTFNDGLAIDPAGNIFASRYYNSTVTKISPDGSTEIFANGFSDPNGLAFGPDGFLYVTNATGNRIDKVSPDGVVSTVISNFTNPAGVAFDPSGNMIIASYQQSKLFVYDTGGNLTEYLTGNGLNGPVGIIFDENENLYIGNFNDGKVLKRSPNGSVTAIGDIPGWMGFLTYANGYVYATAYQGNRIYRIKSDGTEQVVFAGTGNAGTTDGDLLSASFNAPNGIAASATGDTLFVSDFDSRSLRMITGVNATITAIDDVAQPVNTFRLSQNYPNPFNPTTAISYQLSNISSVNLSIYNMLGQLVKTLVAEKQPAGSYTVSWDGTNASGKTVAGGAYIYRLQVGKTTLSRKMMFTK